MAEDEAEKAFFQAQAMNTDSMDYNTVEEQDADSSDSDDYDPSKTLHDQFSAPLTDSNQNEIQGTPPITAQSDSGTPQHGSVPPENDSKQHSSGSYPSETPSRTESRASASVPSSNAHVQPKTRTIGGFVVEDDDEDDKGDTEYEPPAVLGGEDVGTISAGVPEQAVSENANQNISTSDVSVPQAAPDLSTSNDVSNNSYSPPAPASQNDTPLVSGQDLYNPLAIQGGFASNSPVPTPPAATAESSSTSRGRLPHDRVGILEDRIQEDPRGDIPAWLELINEHRSRNKIESAREVYERFFKVFPQAVSPSCLCSLLLHNDSQIIGGSMGGLCKYGI